MVLDNRPAGDFTIQGHPAPDTPGALIFLRGGIMRTMESCGVADLLMEYRDAEGIDEREFAEKHDCDLDVIENQITKLLERYVQILRGEA